MTGTNSIPGRTTCSIALLVALAGFAWIRHADMTNAPPLVPIDPAPADRDQSSTTVTTSMESEQRKSTSRIDSTPPERAEFTPPNILDYTDLSAIVAGHLRTAPRDQQNAARDFFLLQATHMDKTAERARAGANLDAIVGELDCLFMARMRRACAHLLASGKGLLVIEGEPYDQKVLGTHYLPWGGTSQSRVFGRQLQVLVILDEADPELETLARAFVDARAAMLAEKLKAFKSRSFTDRAEVIERCQTRNRQPRNGPEPSWFGIDGRHIDQLTVDNGTMTIRPRV